MHIGQLHLTSSLAATRLAQSAGSETERIRHETSAHDLVVESTAEAMAAEGIGTTHEEQAAGDRDGDGRRAWEFDLANDTPAEEASTDPENEHHAPDPTGQCGSQLDLNG